MNEEAARAILLVQAIETEDRQLQVLSADDRHHASRSARELARWQAAEGRRPANEGDFPLFLQQRATQILQRLGERVPGFTALTAARTPWPLLTGAALLVALAVGFGLDRLGDPHRVDLLSAPLLLILGWNLLVYGALLVSTVAGALRRRRGEAGAPPPWWSRLSLPRLRGTRRWPTPLAAALPHFLARWMRLSAPLEHARAARLWHLASAAFALGALASLVLRGVLVEYRAGWESTFLDAAQVHAVLGLLFAPALAVFPLQGFSLQEVEALRFAGTTLPPASASPASGARWVTLYAASLGLLVVLPRLLLAAWAHLRARRLVQRLTPDLGDPYFLPLRQAAGAVAGRLRVVPYSLRVDAAREQGLARLAQALLGEEAQLSLAPALAYGEEAGAALAQAPAADATRGLLQAVLFNLSATPEQENHGALLAELRRRWPPGFLVLVDASALRERLGGTAAGRLAEREALWQSFCRFHQCEATLVDLLDPTLRPLPGISSVLPATP